MADGYKPMDVSAKFLALRQDASIASAINAWADGAGKLYSSDLPSRCWEAIAAKEVKYKRLKINDKFSYEVEVIWRCQPFMRETTPETHSFTANGTITKKGTVKTNPLIVITGSGNVTCTVAGTQMSFINMSASSPVTVDCESGYVYTGSGAVTMTGNFPVLDFANDTSVLIGTATRIQITPRWGWV